MLKGLLVEVLHKPFKDRSSIHSAACAVPLAVNNDALKNASHPGLGQVSADSIATEHPQREGILQHVVDDRKQHGTCCQCLRRASSCHLAITLSRGPLGCSKLGYIDSGPGHSC